MADAPTRSGDLLPRKLYVAEVAMLPLLWLAPAMALVIGGAVLLDVRWLRDAYDVELDSPVFLWFLAPFMVGHIGSLGYRASRRNAVRKHLGLSPSEHAHLLDRLDAPKAYSMLGLLGIQLACVVALFVVPDPTPAIAWTIVALFAFTLIVGPFAVWLDQRTIREIDEVGWGWLRYLHLPVALLPFGVFVYLVQRHEHVAYALFIRIWDADLSTLEVPDEDLSTLQRIADRLDEFTI